MQNRLSFPPPEPSDKMACIKEFAYDLAYGSLQRLWASTLSQKKGQDGVSIIVNATRAYWDGNPGILETYLRKKWSGDYPDPFALYLLGYLEGDFITGDRADFSLTDKAYRLVESPEMQTVNVFISYSRQRSSTFALLIEARLNALGINAFVDRSIPPGDEWHAHLEERVKNCEFLVCLIAPETLKSKYVSKELEWASENIRIAITHPDYDFAAEESTYEDWLLEFVTNRQRISVSEESAAGYHDAVEKLINAIQLASA